MNINVDELKETLCHKLCGDVQVVERNGRLTIQTPFEFADGDPYFFDLIELPGGLLRVTDSGHTFMHLSYENDIDKFSQGTRGEILEQVLSQGGVTFEGGEVFVDTNPEDLGRVVFRFAQTLTSITDLTFLNRARAESTFYEDLLEILHQIVDPNSIEKDYIYTDMPNAEDYPVDFRIESKADPLFLFGIPNRDKARLATIVLERLLRAQAEFDSVLIFADQSSIPRGDLARLSNAGGEMIASLDAQDDLRRKVARRAT